MGCSLTRTRTESQTMVWYFSTLFEPDRKFQATSLASLEAPSSAQGMWRSLSPGNMVGLRSLCLAMLSTVVYFIRKICSPQGLKSHVCQFKWGYVCLSHSPWGHLRIPQYGENMMLSGFLELYLLKISTFLKVLSFGTVSIFENKHYPLFLLREESKEAPI